MTEESFDLQESDKLLVKYTSELSESSARCFFLGLQRRLVSNVS